MDNELLGRIIFDLYTYPLLPFISYDELSKGDKFHYTRKAQELKDTLAMHGVTLIQKDIHE